KKADILLVPIKMQTANRLSIVIIDQYTEIAKRISAEYSLRVDSGPRNGLHNVVSLDFSRRRNYSFFTRRHLDVARNRRLRFSRLLRIGGDRIFQPVIDLVI